MKAFCLFEQSGTFKKQFIKLGVSAEDYDICNDYGQTDHVIDLFNEINVAFEGGATIFDNFKKSDIVMAFFPCERFEAQIILHLTGMAYGMDKWNPERKILNSMKLNQEMNRNYQLISKLFVIAYRKGFKMVVENPYTTQHYLTRYFPIKPSVIDINRRDRGDYYVKPTQFWFVNFKPKENFIFECVELPPKRSNILCSKVERSEISPQYANRFIREYILEEKNENK